MMSFSAFEEFPREILKQIAPILHHSLHREVLSRLLPLLSKISSEEDITTLLTTFENGTLNKKIREDREAKRRDEERRKFEMNTLTPRVIHNLPYLSPTHVMRSDGIHRYSISIGYPPRPIYFNEEDIQYGCIRGAYVGSQVLDLTNRTILNIGYYEFAICGRRDHLVYIRDEFYCDTQPNLNMYVWDTRTSVTLRDCPMTDPLPCKHHHMRSHPYYPSGKGIYSLNGEYENGKGQPVDTLRIHEDGKEVMRFHIPDGFSCFFKVNNKGILTTNHANKKIEYDLTENERLRVAVIVPLLPVQELLLRITSYLVFEKEWV
jgi:hypothetical protein